MTISRKLQNKKFQKKTYFGYSKIEKEPNAAFPVGARAYFECGLKHSTQTTTTTTVEKESQRAARTPEYGTSSLTPQLQAAATTNNQLQAKEQAKIAL